MSPIAITINGVTLSGELPDVLAESIIVDGALRSDVVGTMIRLAEAMAEHAFENVGSAYAAEEITKAEVDLFHERFGALDWDDLASARYTLALRVACSAASEVAREVKS